MPIDKLQNLLEISKCSVGYLEASAWAGGV